MLKKARFMHFIFISMYFNVLMSLIRFMERLTNILPKLMQTQEYILWLQRRVETTSCGLVGFYDCNRWDNRLENTSLLDVGVPVRPTHDDHYQRLILTWVASKNQYSQKSLPYVRCTKTKLDFIFPKSLHLVIGESL